MQNQDLRNLPFNAWVNLKMHKTCLGDKKHRPNHLQEQIDALDMQEEKLENTYLEEIKNGNI
jgi:hypothetical protein